MSDPILIAEHVGHRYQGATELSLLDVSLTIDAGSALGIVGESGSGKSTLAKLLVGMMDPSAGRLSVHGKRWADVRRDDPRRRSIQMVFQDPYAALNRAMDARDAVAEAYRHWHPVTRAEATAEAARLLESVGVSQEAQRRRPRTLSGGQCQRVVIARALACEPDVLIADEPTSALDVTIQGQILRLLADLREQRGLALVLVSHDLGVVQAVTDTALVLYRGRVVETGPTAELLHTPAHPYTQALVNSVPENSATWSTSQMQRVRDETPGSDVGCVFRSRCEYADSSCAQDPEPPLVGIGGLGATACWHPLRGNHAQQPAAVDR